MNIGERLEMIGSLVLPGTVLADIGTDHAYLPVYLLEEKKIEKAIAGDIAEGPCQAAAATVAMYNKKQQVEIRLGSGLSVLQPGEAACITIAGMGGSTMIDILSADMKVAVSAKRLILQPQTGAPSLRKWLLANGWGIVQEELVWEHKHLYEIIVAEHSESLQQYSEAELEIGPLLLANKHPLLKDQFAKVLAAYKKQLGFMEKSTQATQSEKYKHIKSLVAEVEVLANASNS